MPVLVSLQAVRPASWFVTADKDAARNPARFIPATVTAKCRKQTTTDRKLKSKPL